MALDSCAFRVNIRHSQSTFKARNGALCWRLNRPEEGIEDATIRRWAASLFYNLKNCSASSDELQVDG